MFMTCLLSRALQEKLYVKKKRKKVRHGSAQTSHAVAVARVPASNHTGSSRYKNLPRQKEGEKRRCKHEDQPVRNMMMETES